MVTIHQRFNGISGLCLILSYCLTSLQTAKANLFKEDLFHTIKSSDNNDLCASSTPSIKTSAFSKFDCARQCQSKTRERCDGFNFYDTTTQCDLYYNRTEQYVSNMTTCKYFRRAELDPSLDDFDCPYGFSKVGRQKNCYKLFEQPLTLTDASTTCRNLTGGSDDLHLVYVDNAGEMSDIAAYLMNSSATLPGGGCYSTDADRRAVVWSGGCRASHTGSSQFVWANGCSQQGLPQSAVSKPMNYTNWDGYEPNDALYNATTGTGGEYGAVMVLRDDGSMRWWDAPCTWANCWLCEFERA